MRTITIRDESVAGQLIYESALAMEGEAISVRDIIAARIFAEVTAYNRRLTDRFVGLVHPINPEKEGRGLNKKRRTEVDPEKQVYVALDAFQKNGFFVLVDDHQAESLDQLVVLRPDTIVSFIKLTPLVGG